MDMCKKCKHYIDGYCRHRQVDISPTHICDYYEKQTPLGATDCFFTEKAFGENDKGEYSMVFHNIP